MLRFAFCNITDDTLTYRFYDDPFPNLKGKVKAEQLDGTYMKFKVDYILGRGWSYKTGKHLWRGDDRTEHRIFKYQVIQ